MTRPAVLGCQWFARCENLAAGVAPHPILGYVPCCSRCADLADTALVPGSFVSPGGDLVDFIPAEATP